MFTQSDTMNAVRDDVKVEWVNLGEGWDGDYDADDADDINLLRFDVSKRGASGWEAVDDASYCTQVPASMPETVLRQLLQMLLDEVYESVHEGHSIKKLCERLSWISGDGLR
jgi:hypothetical protein